MPADKQLYLPILVGATQNFKPEIKYQRDDSGENISNKNPNYNELTAIYWAWKNMNNIDAIGLMHYRRVFCKGWGRGFRNVLNQRDIEKMLSGNDVLLPKKRYYIIETNYSHYIHAHNAEPLKVLEEVIKDTYPKYYDSFIRVMKKRSAHMFNMFIMKKAVFNQYSSWLFSVLFEVESKIDISEYSVQEKRVFGYLSELLMDVWIETNNIKYDTVRWKQLGRKHLIKKIVYLVYRKFKPGGTETHF